MQQDKPVFKGIFDDLLTFRTEVRGLGSSKYLALLELNLWRPMVDLGADLLVFTAMVALVLSFGWWLAPFAVVVIGNRQRALGNILHDAGHNNLHRSRRVNDTLATVLIAPLVFVDLSTYRNLHFRHHLQLGSHADPDKMERASVGSWLTHYRIHLSKVPQWRGSALGHLASTSVPVWNKLYIIAWWTLICSLLWMTVGSYYLFTFLALWMIARATAFHAITVFREMCDHYGLVEGSISSFTRDTLNRSMWYYLVHPRNNGYHLTHHLMPAVPYYKLPQAQRLLASTPSYRDKCNVCDSYVFGQFPVVGRWSSEV